MWLPQQKILFSGDFFGPQFPQFPNVFTMRGEKVRKPIEYIHTLDKLIALDAEILVPSHRNHIVGREEIRAGLTLIRDAVQYVHDEVVAGMNAGKSVYELMEEIQLPPELELTQEHGMVSWGVKSIWEYYATWFHFDTPTELYPVPARDIYADLAEMAGVDALLAKAGEQLAAQKPVHALHFLEVVLELEPDNRRAMEGQLAVYEMLLQDAVEISKNNYEKDYMRTLIAQTKEKLAAE
jgi:alkyl sulfatase BDS1-like metallo-beta-lactamase superfamily hydrolase